MKNYTKHTVSVCHGLRLVPIDAITRYGRIGAEVIMRTKDAGLGAKAINGSMTVLTSTDDTGFMKKTITYRRSEGWASDIEELDRLVATRLVATYVDERGRGRVCGSPDFPLSLKYQIAGGLLMVTIEGSDTTADAFAM